MTQHNILLRLNQLNKTIQPKTPDARQIMTDLSLTIYPGDFVTIVGGNGAGKSTLFNSITGVMQPDSGSIILNGTDITKDSATKRAKKISRVFQDPKMGTAPRMTVAENLLLALNQGKHWSFKHRNIKTHRTFFKERCQTIGNGLEHLLDTPAGNLSGGQRQALSFLMATIHSPELLLLDEHTAALDPKTATQLMHVTHDVVVKEQLTCLMITHQLTDALKYGNRLILLKNGQVALDINQVEKESLKLEDLYQYY